VTKLSQNSFLKASLQHEKLYQEVKGVFPLEEYYRSDIPEASYLIVSCPRLPVFDGAGSAIE
jgi:hypothetical protein